MSKPTQDLDFELISVLFGREFYGNLQKLDVPVEFPYLSDTTEYMPSGRALEVAGIELPENPPNFLTTTAVHNLVGLPKKGNIQVIGGAAGLNLDGVPTINDLISGMIDNKDLPDAYYFALDIYRAANNLESNIITGGTQSGVMALLSSIWLTDQILNEYICRAAIKKSDFLGMPIERIVNTNTPSLLHVVPKRTTIYPGNDEVKMDEWPCPLAPCTGFIVVGGGDGWGQQGEALEKSSYVTSFIPAADHAISSLPRIKN